MNELLYKLAKGGKITTWQAGYTMQTDGTARIDMLHGFTDGKKTNKSYIISEGKNIGRSNETTIEKQAQLELAALYAEKRDRDGYYNDIASCTTSDSFLPMLALKFEDKKKTVLYPLWGQYKLNGVRCITYRDDNGFIQMWSRKGKSYNEVVLNNHPKLRAELERVMRNGEMLDGELYVHGMSFQRIASAVKKVNKYTPQLEYHVYDIPMRNDETYTARWLRLDNIFKTYTLTYLKEVKTVVILDEADVEPYHDEFVKDGYEGIILRSGSVGRYEFGKRSAHLLKFKKFMDEEFEITGSFAEEQNINGVVYTSIVFTCKTADGEEFNCRPKGTLEEREEMWNEREVFIGKMLTVRFFAWTEKGEGKGRGVPQFPVGITVRDYE